MKKKMKAFTLAEVLITLGIIGVVAAMTLPSLIGSYQKQAWVTQLRKTVSTLEQGFQKMRADAGGVDSLEDTEPFLRLQNEGNWYEGGGGCYGISETHGCSAFFNNDLRKYFNINEFVMSPDNYFWYWRNSDVGSDDMRNSEMIVMSDGALLYFIAFPSNYNNYKIVGAIDIDVNGFKAPNKYGYDIFRFTLLDSGTLIDSGVVYNSGQSDYKERCLSGEYDAYCYAYLAANGWKMDY